MSNPVTISNQKLLNKATVGANAIGMSTKPASSIPGATTLPTTNKLGTGATPTAKLPTTTFPQAGTTTIPTTKLPAAGTPLANTKLPQRPATAFNPPVKTNITPTQKLAGTTPIVKTAQTNLVPEIQT